MSYAYTKNVSVDVSPLGTSLYKIVTSPVQMEFTAEDFDVYTISARLLYDSVVSQTISVGLFEGGRASKGIEFDVEATNITITMRVSVVEAPHYPTADEISDKMWEKWQNELNVFEASQSALVNKMSDTVVIIGSLAVISFTISIVLMIGVFYTHRRVAELSEWGIRHEREER